MEFCGVKGKEFSFRCSNYTNFSNKFGYFKFITLLLKIDRFVEIDLGYLSVRKPKSHQFHITDT